MTGEPRPHYSALQLLGESGPVVPYMTYCFVRKGDFDCHQLPPHMKCLVNINKEPVSEHPKEAMS